MSRSCLVCTHERVQAINEALRSRSIRRVAADFGLSYQSVTRHARNHAVLGQPETPEASDPLDELTKALRTKALSGDPAAAREYRLALSTQKAHQAPAEYDLLADPRWKRLQIVILRALERHPQARLDVIEAIRSLDEA